MYTNLDMLTGTLVNCERQFSQAKFILSDTRKRTNPTLLKVNGSFWNVFSVGQALGDTKVNANQHADGGSADNMGDDCALYCCC